MFDFNAAVHAGVFFDDVRATFVAAGDENVGGLIGPFVIRLHAERFTKTVCVGKCVGDEGHSKATVVDVVSILIGVCEVVECVTGTIEYESLGVKGRDRFVHWEES